jgi:hypothetical protein
MAASGHSEAENDNVRDDGSFSGKRYLLRRLEAAENRMAAASLTAMHGRRLA